MFFCESCQIENRDNNYSLPSLHRQLLPNPKLESQYAALVYSGPLGLGHSKLRIVYTPLGLGQSIPAYYVCRAGIPA
jgi:hypothetical protein